jgi:hypothetical protein
MSLDEDSLVTVTHINPDGTQQRKEMRLSEYYNRLDCSKQYQLCSNKYCRHDIDEHAAVKDYKKNPAGKCNVALCRCRKYQVGELVTKKELESISKQGYTQQNHPETWL